MMRRAPQSIILRDVLHLRAYRHVTRWEHACGPHVRLYNVCTPRCAGTPSIEDVYQKKTPVEHVLLRPGMYVGGTAAIPVDTHVWDEEAKRMVFGNIQYIPGLLKIFDEILVNAMDHRRRDSSVNRIDVEIVQGGSDGQVVIRIRNSGNGVPVVKHKKEGLYVPELVFGHLLTGSNFNDEEQRITGGAFGYGAKLTNILSKEFSVETVDLKSKKKFKKIWRNNLSSSDPCVITDITPNTEPYTLVEFRPDIARFNVFGNAIPSGTMAMMKRRVLDAAGTINSFKAGTKVLVTLNGEPVTADSFEAYVSAFYPGTQVTMVSPSSKMEVGIAIGDAYNAVSFVNGVCTEKGGTHVDEVVSKLCKKLGNILDKRYPELNIKPSIIKSRLHVFVNCLVEKPTFSSQSKDVLTSPPETFGYNVKITDKDAKAILDSGLEDVIVDSLRAKEDLALKRQAKRVKNQAIRNIPKLEDANDAGTKNSKHCTLILTEGDSAKSLAVAGLAIVGRDRYGVFPLRGKLLNVRDVTKQTALNNEEIGHLITILGLDINTSYDKMAPEKRPLRYGKVMIMTDQDHDGSHIKGLLINLFHKFWPGLLEEGSFLEQFITPIIKARNGAVIKEFYSIPEYNSWWANVKSTDVNKWTIKYYKGLGTSTAAEGRQYFGALSKHRVVFNWNGVEDGTAIDQAFGKAHVVYRKEWLNQVQNEGVDYSTIEKTGLSYSDFVNKELIQFSRADLIRSIPSVVDGLKPSQRKVLYGCSKRGEAEVKVAQLAGYVSEHTGYHHGEVSLHSTIIGMAQDYVGSNNLPLLEPIGQFGTRLQGGKDAASARYIYTRLSKYARVLYPKADDPVLDRVEDDGMIVEPIYYAPIIPTILVNGTEGIGTGWSTQVPCYNPASLAQAVLHRLGSTDPSGVLAPLMPWYHGFKGTVVPTPTGGDYVTNGLYEWDGSSNIVKVSELPIGNWTEDYKTFLSGLIEKGDLVQFKEYHTETSAAFELMFTPGVLLNWKPDDVIDKLRLTRKIKMGNMHLFNPSGGIKRYDTPEAILDDFMPVRLGVYEKRKSYMVDTEQAVSRKQSEISRFLNHVVGGDIPVHSLSRRALEQELKSRKFHEIDGSHNYLMNIPMWQLTSDSVVKASTAAAEAEARVQKLRNTSTTDMWKQELLSFLQQLPPSMTQKH